MKEGTATFLVLSVTEFTAPSSLSPIYPAPGIHCVVLGLPAPVQCSATCGEGIQQRQVVCRNSSNALGQCEGVKPDTVQVCSLPACGGEQMGWGGPAPSSGHDPATACILALKSKDRLSIPVQSAS